MVPGPGAHLLHYVGDRVRFVLTTADGRPLPAGWQVRLRTNLGRANAMRHELIAARGGLAPYAGGSWRDIVMDREGDQWVLDLPLTEIGPFRAKAYALDPERRQHWPPGHDIAIVVQPDQCRTGNTIYCAFVRQFGATRTATSTVDDLRDEQLAVLDRHGYTAIPPSGTLRDLIAQLPHIADNLGCRILHLLPVTPTPTVYARMGRFGSPYAGQDLTAIDPALVVFDRATTGVDQFRELTYAAHHRGMRVLLDVVLNHTGWGSTLLDGHPEWFRRNADGTFHSPGAWGTTWEDLVELDHHHHDLWDVLADALLEWCRRGVDGFRCDAGYMVPCEAWQYITAKVRLEFPDTVFLLEGLGGAWEVTATLLTDGGLQWAYSELFQNHDGAQVGSYIDHIIRHAGTLGTLVNYSETHDNERLAGRGRTWSLLRNRLCGLASTSGGFGFTAGVE
jgi:starch synthase (maltosyl-transferring)